MRWKLTIAYDGAPFRGWQSQSGGNTVQDLLEAAVGRILGAAVTVHGSGRTDAGVHALGQVAHFDVPDGWRMDAAAWLRALQVHLPPQIRVMRAEAAEPRFHARFDAVGKTYRYRLWHGAVLPPHEWQRAWHVPHVLDEVRLREVLSLCAGRHDFAAFAAFRGDVRSDADTVRTIHRAGLERKGEEWVLTWSGDGFLYRMVRLLTGAAVRVAQGRAGVAWFRGLLDEPAGRKNHHQAPADGLYLVSVDYGTAGDVHTCPERVAGAADGIP
jgi:tRNA pseudouridine38-40 synthase